MKLRIESDGTSRGTRVLDENGNLIGGVQWVQLFISQDQTETEVVLSLSGPEIVLDLEERDGAPGQF